MKRGGRFVWCVLLSMPRCYALSGAPDNRLRRAWWAQQLSCRGSTLCLARSTLFLFANTGSLARCSDGYSISKMPPQTPHKYCWKLCHSDRSIQWDFELITWFFLQIVLVFRVRMIFIFLFDVPFVLFVFVFDGWCLDPDSMYVFVSGSVESRYNQVQVQQGGKQLQGKMNVWDVGVV